MTSASVLDDSQPAVPLTPRSVLEAWRGITRRQARVTFLLGCALFLLGVATGIALVAPPRGLLFTFLGAQIRAFTLLLAFVVADKVTGGDPNRRSAYALAVIVGALVATSVAVTFVKTMLNWFVFDEPVSHSIGLVFYFAFDMVLLGGAAVWVILDRRRAARARERMQRAELERIDAEKRSIESDLQALQARVEPQFLFNTLAQVHDLYRIDATRGERMLDDLIAYLRAAMPLMRDTASTVRQEIDLARAYLDIVRIRLGDRLDFAIEVPPEIGEVRMPPMMLLPLIDHAVVYGLESTKAAGAIRIGAELREGRLRLTVADSGAGFVPGTGGDGIASIRERLAALYGESAHLDLHPAGIGATEAVLDLPLEVSVS